MRRPTRRDCLKHKKRPTSQDRLVVLLLSLGLFLLVMALGLWAGPMIELVLFLLATFAVVTINLLFAYSTWDEPDAQEHEPDQKSRQSKE